MIWFAFYISLFSIQVSDAYVKVLSVIVFFGDNFSVLGIFLFLNNFCSVKYVLLAFFILSCKSVWRLLSSLSITPRHLKYSALSTVQFFTFNCPVLFCFELFFHSTIICFVFPWFMCSNNFLAMFSISTKSCLISTSFFPINTMSQHMLIHSVVLYQFLYTIRTSFILCITFFKAKLNNTCDRVALFQFCFILKKETVFHLF